MSAAIKRDSSEFSEKWRSAYGKVALYPTNLDSRPFNAEARVWQVNERDKELEEELFSHGHINPGIHADRNQKEREDAINAFKRKKTPIMVATDIAACAINIHIESFDLPPVIDDYIHRVGRTARVGNPNPAIHSSIPSKIALWLPPSLACCRTKHEIPELLKDYREESGPGAEDEFCHEDLEGVRPSMVMILTTADPGTGGGMVNAFGDDDWGFKNPSQTNDARGFDSSDYNRGATKTRRVEDEWDKQDHGYNVRGGQREDW
ncbi:hypothetical protein BJ742DRAFT_776352 [Cladochytrium replicatum]|nr:hypothetical protein BJ742DRAFT_776352 [Cladochytrium replicatum]